LLSDRPPLLGEKLMPVARAVEVRLGRKAHPVTISRWVNRGVRGTRLESVLVLGRRMTSLPAVGRFLAATASPSEAR
jgi:hypothetical protein